MISVVVPALNEEEWIVSCLKSLTTQSDHVYELIVVGGESSDRTVDLAEQYAHKVIVYKCPAGAARNRGARSFRGEIFAFMDADTIACPSLVQVSFNEQMVAFTSPRRLEKYGRTYIVGLYLFNGLLTLLTCRSLRAYPPVRCSRPQIIEPTHFATQNN